jgi:hypothetical protein
MCAEKCRARAEHSTSILGQYHYSVQKGDMRHLDCQLLAAREYRSGRATQDVITITGDAEQASETDIVDRQTAISEDDVGDSLTRDGKSWYANHLHCKRISN